MIGLEALLFYDHFPSSEARSSGGKLSTSSQMLYAWHDSPYPPSTPVSPFIVSSLAIVSKFPCQGSFGENISHFEKEAIVCP